MTDGSPDISIIVAAFNAEATIDIAVRSALGQAGVSVEVLVIDDCSTDGTVEAATAAGQGDPRLNVLRQSANAGPAAARNRGIDRARGQFLTVLDADDRMASSRLAGLVNLARDHNCDFAADDILKVDSHDIGASATRLWSEVPIGHVHLAFKSFVEGNLTALHGGRGELGFLKPVMSRSFLDKQSLRYDETMRLGEDYALYAAALARGATFVLTDPHGYFALVRSDSLSGHHTAADLAALAAADQRLAKEQGLGAEDLAALLRHEIETQKRCQWARLIDAVKARDLAEFGRCFATRPTVCLSLLGRLGEQAVLRSTAKVRSIGKP